MFAKIFYRVQIVSLILLLIALAVDLSGHYFFTEKLYSVELASEEEDSSRSASVQRPVLNPSKNVRIENNQSANPFLPVLPELPVLPSVTSSVQNSDEVFAKKLVARELKFSAFSGRPDSVSARELNHCQALVEKTLSVLPAELTASLDDLTLFFNNREPRGLSNSHVLELRCANLSDAEVTSVFVHELGHIVDLGYFRSAGNLPSGFLDGSIVITADDPSVEFYSLSWKESKVQKFSAQRLDFVSGYAMADAFEDFAESFNFYVLHGADFRALASESSVLQKKYEFLRDRVFSGREFASARVVKKGVRVWDTTLLPADLVEFFSRA